MSWFCPAKHLSAAAEQVLRELVESNSSEAAGVADCLNTIAENDEAQAADRYLLTCAAEIRDWAQEFIDRLKQARKQ